MKTTFAITIYFAFTLLLLSCKAQKTNDSLIVEKTIKTDFLRYNDLLSKKQFKESMEYIYPKFFDLVSKQEMIGLLEQSLNNPDVVFNMERPSEIKVAKIQEIDNQFYSIISFLGIFKMKFKNDNATEQIQTKTDLTNTFGEEHVTYNGKTGFYTIRTKKYAVAISNNRASDWKFLDVDPNQMPILEKLLPKQIVETVQKKIDSDN